MSQQDGVDQSNAHVDHDQHDGVDDVDDAQKQHVDNDLQQQLNAQGVDDDED